MSKKILEEKVALNKFGHAKRKYIKTMPYEWVISVSKINGKGTLTMAIALYYWAGIKKAGFNKPFEISIGRLGKEFNVNEATAYRAFKKLKAAGFAHARNNAGKKSAITLFEKPIDLSTLGTDDSGLANNMLFDNFMDSTKSTDKNDFGGES